MQLFTIPEMAQAQVAPQAMRNTALSPSVKNKSTLSKSRYNNRTFPDTMTRTDIRVAILTRLHNMFRLLPINGHNMNKRSAEINFRFKSL
jgi:hypothetical protein